MALFQSITEAFITSNNDTQQDTEQINTDENNNSNGTSIKCEELNSTISQNVDCGCNSTNQDVISQKQDCETNLHAPSNTESPNQQKDCSHDNEIEANNCQNHTKNEIPNNDTILKYVYKKTDKVDNLQKSKGHSKNSLKRRKRYISGENIDEFINNKKIPIEVNYETSHGPRDIEVVAPARITDKSINAANLADFNIETLHDNKPIKKGQNLFQGSQESNHGSAESSEEGSNKKYSRDREEYRKSTRKPDFTDTDSSESLEGSEENKGRKNSRYSNKITSKESAESNERDRKNENSGSIENSHESTENDRTRGDYHNEPKLNKSSKVPIQEVDLDDFSYERIQVNKNGEVEVAKDNQENIDSIAPVSHSTTTKPDAKLEKYDKSNSLLSKEETSSSVERNNESGELVNINDGETKPVVELNSDANSGELSDEVSKESLKTDINNEDQSLETILGVKDIEKSDDNDKTVTPKLPKEDENVKQEFERIPLDYKHNGKDKKTLNENKASINPEKTNENEDAGTLDTFLPKDEKYDEHLNIKFDDLTLTLPEIKLPDDILSYAYEGPSYRSENKKEAHKQPFYHYNDEDSEENQEEKDKDTDNDEVDHGYGRYYGDRREKQDYKKAETEEDDDEDEDLYEKFVRERFGKRGSFEKRSEKLQDARSNEVKNAQLNEALKGILKKTAEIQKEAEKSGDPKAGYLWTLEYGENA